MILAALVLMAGGWLSTTSAAIIVPQGEQSPHEQSLTLLLLERYQAAQKMLDSILAENPDDDIALHYRGIARYHLKDYNGAIGDYYEALKRRPDDANILTDLAIVRNQTGEPQKAVAYLEQALKKDPDNTRAMNQLAWILAVSPAKELQDGKRAVQLAEKLVSSKENAHTLDTLAAAYAADGQFDKAISSQKKVIAILANENQTDQLPYYLDRLQAYEKRKVWQPEKQEKAVENKVDQEKRDEQEKKALADEISAPDQKTESSERDTAKQEPAGEVKPTAAAKADSEMARSQTPPSEPSKSEPAPANPPATDKKEPTQADAAPQKIKDKPLTPASTTPYTPYTIQIASFKDGKAAHRKAYEFRRKGDPVFTAQVLIEPSGIWHRLFYGWFKTAEEAAETAKILKKRNFVEVLIVRKPYTILMAESKQPELLDRIEQRLIHLGHMPYRLHNPADSRLTRLCIGAYGDNAIPQALYTDLKKEGYQPKTVLR